MAMNAAKNPDLVQVFDTNQESEASVIQGLLEAEGIESMMSNLDAPQDVLPGVGGVVVRVNAADAQRAKQLIEEYRNNADAEGGELAGEEPKA